MDKFSEVTKAFGTLRTSGYSRTSQDAHDGESLLNEPELADADCQEGTRYPDTANSARPQTPWLKYVFLVLLFVVYSFLLVTYAPRKLSDSECGQQVALWCK